MRGQLTRTPLTRSWRRGDGSRKDVYNTTTLNGLLILINEFNLDLQQTIHHYIGNIIYIFSKLSLFRTRRMHGGKLHGVIEM